MDLLSLGGFLIFVTVLIVLDLWLFQRTQHEITLRQAAVMSAFWVAGGFPSVHSGISSSITTLV